MSLVLAATLAAVSAIQPSCSWDRPGLNPYRGKVRDALERYADIPAADRIALARRIEQGQADEQVEITRDAIRGQRDYYPGISDMHFGAASVCHQVTRSKWDPARVEPGAVYCVKEHCILVPKICGNVSRIGRRGARPVAVIEPKPPGYQPRSRLADVLPGMDLGLADADPEQLSEEELADIRDRLRDAKDRLATGDALEDDDAARRNRLAGHYSMHDDFSDPAADEPFTPAPVPEPSHWAMLLGGLALLGAAARRRAGR